MNASTLAKQTEDAARDLVRRLLNCEHKPTVRTTPMHLTGHRLLVCRACGSSRFDGPGHHWQLPSLLLVARDSGLFR